jgi:hypothetical protein
VVRNQLKVSAGRQARAVVVQQRQALFERQRRQALFDALQPVALANCQLERFGETHDGGYLMCGNLLGDIQSGYSYGIAGYDKWGCDISTRFNVAVHQYDCFDTTQPVCSTGKTVFHPECVGGMTRTVEGRLFDTINNQFAKNGDRAKRIALKIDVEGAEWDSLLFTPDEIFERIDQMAVEFHRVEEEKFLSTIRRLKQFFEIAHIHFNNASCIEGLEPFTTWAYEVLFVSKRLAVVDRSRKASGQHPLDTPNNPAFADCQPKTP